MAASEQIKALKRSGLSVDEIAGEMSMDRLAVAAVTGDELDYSSDDRIVAKDVILNIARGGVDVPAAIQLKAAMYVHSNGNSASGPAMNINVLSNAILQARLEYEARMRNILGPSTAIDITPKSEPAEAVQSSIKVEQPAA